MYCSADAAAEVLRFAKLFRMPGGETMEKENEIRTETPLVNLSALKKNRRRKHAAALGAFVALFALIGLITTLTAGFNLVKSMIGHEREIARFEKLITPLVMFDPVPFDTVSEAGDVTLLQASMWQTLLNEDKSVYAFDQNGLLIIPASDIDVSAAKLFGTGIELNHQTFGDSEMTFMYDATSRTYRVPPRGYLGIYTPEVLSYYVLLRNRTGYYVTSIRTTDPYAE